MTAVFTGHVGGADLPGPPLPAPPPGTVRLWLSRPGRYAHVPDGLVDALTVFGEAVTAVEKATLEAGHSADAYRWAAEAVDGYDGDLYGLAARVRDLAADAEAAEHAAYAAAARSRMAGGAR